MPEEKPKVDEEVRPKPEEPKEEDAATETDAEVARNQPAVYVDAFLISSIDDGIMFRMTFAEGTASKRGRIRSAILMPRDDVKELVRILGSLLAKTEKEDTSAAKTQSLGK